MLSQNMLITYLSRLVIHNHFQRHKALDVDQWQPARCKASHCSVFLVDLNSGMLILNSNS